MMLTVQSVQSVQDDMAGLYRPYEDMARPYKSYDDVAEFDWQAWLNDIMTRGVLLVNGKVPHGPIMGYHVAPLYWFMSRYVKLLGSMGFDPQTSPPYKI
jgi:hypothetical protein